MEKVLQSFSFFPSKTSKRGAFYFAIGRKEGTPSLHLNYRTNKAHDFGSGKTYDNVSLVQTIQRCSVSEALEYLSNFEFSFPKQDHSLKRIAVEKKKRESDWKIRKVKSVEHQALISYLGKRRVSGQKIQVKEIHYTLNKKFYFGIAFQNDSGGWEVRNKYAKLCLGKKDITTVRNGNCTLRIFEGFFDYLSFLELDQTLKFGVSDYVILNSISLVGRLENALKNHDKIELYLDNDNAGNSATEILKKMTTSKIEDCRLLYPNHKDLNDFLCKNGRTDFRGKIAR